MNRYDIDILAKSVLTTIEYNSIINIAARKKNIFNKMADFDSKLGGAGIHNINKGKTGRYHGKDRDVYRPLQYIYSYFQMNSEQVDWVTREIIHMCGLHLESLIKRLTRITRLPLGQALTLSIVRTKLDDQTYKYLKLIISPYNDAKHRLDHDKDTHLFDIESALFCYAATRKIANKIIPLASLYTPLWVWD